ncbi:hypothetical protein GCM10009569_16500 [Arthrobacter russicus]|uniref:ABC-type Fe3+ transport system permease subunit n=1 Tax=Arthrobacter russicus TaxID=172040 RepID=A0ABU1J8S2_9MICC|nr:ABC-type Fe3+ transport system permease subunit [Arthrobacter russicus]
MAARTAPNRPTSNLSAAPAKARKRGGGTALAFPTWAFLLFFFVMPIGLVLWYSFGQKPDLFSAHDNSVFSFDRYFEALNETFLKTFWNTLGIGLTGTLICLLIAVPFAYWLAIKAPGWFRPLGLALVLVPFWTNFLVRTLGWQILLAPEGPVSNWLQQLGLSAAPLDFLYTRGAVQLGRGLQLPAADDPAAFRGHRPGRAGVARSQPGPRRQPLAHLFHHHLATGHARHRLRRFAGLHPADG